MGLKNVTLRLPVGKPEGKRPKGRTRCRWVDNIKMDLVQILLGELDWIGVVRDRYRGRALVNSVMNEVWRLLECYVV
jgi:hypothetical protein